MAGKISKSTLIFTTFMLVVIALVAAIVLFDKTGGLDYTVTFDDAKGVTVGAPVKLNGVEIGQVNSVGLAADEADGVEVGIHIYAESRNRVHDASNTTARIKKDAMVLGRPFIEIINRGEKGEALEQGSVIEGMDSWADAKFWQTGKAANDAWEKALTVGEESFEGLENWAKTDGTVMKDEVLRYLGDIEEAASEKTAGTRDRVDGAIEKGKALYDKFKSEQAPEMAEKVRESMSAMKEAGSELSDDARSRIDEFLKNTEEESVTPAEAEEAQQVETPAVSGGTE